MYVRDMWAAQDAAVQATQATRLAAGRPEDTMSEEDFDREVEVFIRVAEAESLALRRAITAARVYVGRAAVLPAETSLTVLRATFHVTRELARDKARRAAAERRRTELEAQARADRIARNAALWIRAGWPA